ncbi:hypothetical protein [Aliamphritea spongicola]|nr:hypothetical protein [Aliamphritea spongicola]
MLTGAACIVQLVLAGDLLAAEVLVSVQCTLADGQQLLFDFQSFLIRGKTDIFSADLSFNTLYLGVALIQQQAGIPVIQLDQYLAFGYPITFRN